MTLGAENLHVRLGEKAVLTGVSASFARGQVSAVIGPNGAGKSTLLACLAGLRTPDQGRVMLDDSNLLDLPARHRAQRIGFLPQNPEVAWAVEARTLIGLGRTPFIGAQGLSAEDEAAVNRALEQTNTADLAHRNALTLSGGERARVLIARVLAGQPAWILADEALTGLDPGYQLDVAGIFRTLAHDSKCGVIVTLHDLAMALRIADRIIVLADGGVLADGPPAAVTPEVLRAAYGIEARVMHGPHGPIIDVMGRS